MSDKTYDPADPRLTAYVLGELDDSERQDVEQQMQRCAETRTAIEEIRETVGMLTSALANEPTAALTDAQRAAIAAEVTAPVIVQRASNSNRRGQLAAFAAGITATALTFLLVVPQFQQSGWREHEVVSENLNSLSAKSAIITDGVDYTYPDINHVHITEQGEPQPVEGLIAISGKALIAKTDSGVLVDKTVRVQSGEVKLRYSLVNEKSAQPSQGVTGSGVPAITTTSPAIPQPTAQPDQKAAVTFENLAQNNDRVQDYTTKLSTIVNKEKGVRRSSRPNWAYGLNLGLNQPTTDPTSRFSFFGRGGRPADGDRSLALNSPGDLASPSLINRSKTRISGIGIFERGQGGQEGQQAPMGWYDSDDGEPANEQYLPIIENEFLTPVNDPLSTFSIDVDTASYSNVRRFLKQNQWPPANAVRIEEMVNYFHYDYPEPTDGRPFSVNLEVGPCPWNSDHRLVRVGLKGKDIDKSQRPPSNLVFLLDVSGSMRDANKLPLVKTAMEMLVGEMTEDDRIAIVTYAGKAGLKLESTSGQEKTRIIDAIHSLSAGGSTNGEAGIKLAYEQAVRHFIDDGANCVILCTDGDFNVGNSGNKELVELIQDKAKSKVFLSVFGFGMGNLKDGKLEQIADKGNGQYGYIDDEKEAHKVFVEELVGTLYTIAKDVKIQVEFNPQQVGGYRLIGYENRMLAAADFNDDTKDAGEIGAGHTVTALYEIVPFDKLPAANSVDDLKYQKPVKPNDDDKVTKELLTLKLRYKQPDADESVEIDFVLTDDKPRTEMPSVDFEWAVSVSGFGLLLRNSQYRGQADFDLIRELALGSRGDDESGRRREFLDLVYTARAMQARALGKPIPPRESLPEDKARELAAVEGKYSDLLKKIEVQTDAETYGAFAEYGYWAGNSWGGHENLPKGHWVYVAPHWYIWGEASEAPTTSEEK